MGSYELAVEDFDEAISLAPQNPNSYYSRGQAYDALGKSNEALRDIQKALELGYAGP